MITNEKLPDSYQKMSDWLKSRRRILVVTHARPDGDALGSSLALSRVLRAMGTPSASYFAEEPPDSFGSFIHDDVLIGDIDISPFDYLLAVDCATAPRLALPNEETLEDLQLPCANIDHHISNEEYGEINLVDAKAAATCEIIAYLLEAFDYPVPAGAATDLLIGLTTDTGCFRFNNTSSKALRAGAWLIDQGGDYQKVMEAMYFNEPLTRMRLHAKAIETLKLAHNGRLAYFFVTQELLDSCGAALSDAENLVDSVRTLAGVEVVCRMQEAQANVRFSLRSQNPQYPIIEMARKIGGGGHALAAGATMENATLKEAEAKLLELTEELFNG